MFSAAALIYAFGIFITVNVVSGGTLPSYIHPCKRSDPNLDKCVQQSILDIKPYLKKGIAEFKIPPVEPLEIPVFNVPGDNPNENLAVGRNLVVRGVSDFSMDKLKIDLSTPNKPVIHFTMTFPRLNLEGDYEVNTKILVLPIKGKGPMRFEAINTKADAIMVGQIYKKGGKSYLRFNRMDLSLHMQDYNVYLGNLFNGDKVLEEATNQALNDNKEEFKKALNPLVTKTVITTVLDLANSIIKDHSYDDIFPL